MYGVDPAPGQVGKGAEVCSLCQHLRLEPAHGACRRRTVLHRSPADELAHHRIPTEVVGVVDVLVACEAREDRLAQEADEAVATILTGASVGKSHRRHVGQAQSVVEFAVKQQTTVGTDGRFLERELDGAVELEPQRVGIRLTRRVRFQIPAPSWLSY